MYELIITEKPKSAQKIAFALDNAKPIKEANQGVPYYKVTHGNKDIVVTSAVGHLFGINEKEDNNYRYPVFDVEWQPSFEMSKGADFSKKYFNTIKKLAKDATTFTVATDFDIEGEVIGLNIVRYLCKQKDARRMKFSTLTKPDLVAAYEHASPHLEWGQARAGETRHILDWFYGINLSRALTSSIKKVGLFKVLSSGRVQGPALKLLADREKEIKAFIPTPFWQVELDAQAGKEMIIALHEKGNMEQVEAADEIVKKTKGKNGEVSKLDRSRFGQNPPTPFDLTTLQTEAFRVLRISPKATLAIAQTLYTDGLISYPRTSSQVLPPSIGYKGIIKSLSEQDEYKQKCDILLAKSSLNPHNGLKTDPAHPAIYPTGIPPKVLDSRQKRVYDLITKRFLATFGDKAFRESMKLTIEIEKEKFIATGTRTVEKGWHVLYEPYVRQEEKELPALKEGDKIINKAIKRLDKETSPPSRFNQASIIKELEKRNLGTKSTRAAIVDSLNQRGYVTGVKITVTELGLKTITTLEKYCPEIIDEELTRHFELELEKIRDGDVAPSVILEEAQEELTKILAVFKKNELNIGKSLARSEMETKEQESYIGECPKCKGKLDGKLKIIFSKKTRKRFIACDKYPKCENTYPLPQNGKVAATEKLCEHCQQHMISVQRPRQRPQDVCINPNCPAKKIANEKVDKEIADLQNGSTERKCPLCGSKLVVRSSFYGKFLGCSNYPKCRHTENLNGNVKKKDESSINKI